MKHTKPQQRNRSYKEKNQTELKVKELKMKFFMNKNLPDLVKDEPTEQIPDRINPKSTPRHITIKLLKMKDKQS